MKSLTNLTTFVLISLLLLTIFTMTGCGSGGGDAVHISAVTAGVQKSVAPGALEKFVPDELLIQFFAGVSKEKSDEVLRGHRVSEVDEIKPIRVKRIKVPGQALEQVKAALAKNPHVKFVEKNYIAEISAIPNDPSYPSQWHLPKISAPTGWDISSGSGAASIAIIDSGIDPAHPDLASKILPGYNFLYGTTDTHDVQGHGTKVAGSAAAIGNNGIGVAGVAWYNRIVPLVVVDPAGSASYSNIANAIIFAADCGVRVINISIAGSSASSTLENAVTYAWNKGSLIFAGAGNAGTTALSYPAACSKAIAISSTDSTDNKSSFSNYGSWISMAAPGSAIYTTVNGGGFASVSGTSFSSPIAAGLAGLILSVNPDLTNQQVKDIMIMSVDDLGAQGFDNYFGYGRINIEKSLGTAATFVTQADTMAPSVTITSPSAGAVVSGTVAVNTSGSDNLGIVKMELHVDDILVSSDTSQPFTFLWDSSSMANGEHQLKVKAYDAVNNVGSVTTNISVSNVQDTVAPLVNILSPEDGASVGTKSVVINISSSDNVAVTETELYIDGTLKATSASSTLIWTWNVKKVLAGQHEVSARAIDAAGNSGTRTITVWR